MFKNTLIAASTVLAFAAPALADTTVIRETTVVDAPVVVPGPVTTGTTVTTHTATLPAPIPGTSRAIHFEDFDLNRNNVLSMDEVGEMLFRLYDTDGNMVIDNNEYERPSVLTFAPMTQTTSVSYDFDNDGVPDKTVYTYDTFMQRTQLSRFDHNGNGLSPHEFTGKSFLQADVDDSKAIEMKEWQGTYVASIDARNRADAALNK